ncbi:unnamed protein product [Staurois parvus]|uniref:Uncharacterized protein n=1 Tax=Staurois parvus TaxID=386267 RepID=A0ABN9CI71_9NEOB|nr:unnamed protein product [Staurois parvus]
MPSVMPVNAHQCHLPVPITAASLAHISEGEKLLIYKTITKNLFIYLF